MTGRTIAVIILQIPSPEASRAIPELREVKPPPSIQERFWVVSRSRFDAWKATGDWGSRTLKSYRADLGSRLQWQWSPARQQPQRPDRRTMQLSTKMFRLSVPGSLDSYIVNSGHRKLSFRAIHKRAAENISN